MTGEVVTLVEGENGPATLKTLSGETAQQYTNPPRARPRRPPPAARRPPRAARAAAAAARGRLRPAARRPATEPRRAFPLFRLRGDDEFASSSSSGRSSGRRHARYGPEDSPSEGRRKPAPEPSMARGPSSTACSMHIARAPSNGRSPVCAAA